MAVMSLNPRTGARGAEVEGVSVAEVQQAAARAAALAPVWAAAEVTARARLLRATADALEARGPQLSDVMDFETGLGAPRVQAELARTTYQLRAFADHIESTAHLEVIRVPADPAAAPMPRPDLRRMLVPVGPVAVFTPSNFPLAYGVLGGDTASALAAGCPVVVKGHPSHPHTSQICAEAVAEAAEVAGAPAGIVGLLQSAAPEVSRALVSAPEIQAVGFTGSQAVGRLLFDVACARPDPIPFYGELGSVNPIFVGQAAAAARAEAIAAGYVASVTGASGQFCTKPGLVFVPTGSSGDRLVTLMAAEMSTRGPAVLLNEGLQATLRAKVARTLGVPGVRAIGSTCEVPADGVYAAPRLFMVDADTFFVHPALHEEHFGPVALIVRADPPATVEAARRLDGQLTASIHADADDEPWARELVGILITKAGRLIWNGYPTGLAVTPATMHGGPYPASTNALHSSVGLTAIRRFLRPVCFQGFPDSLLPPELRDGM
jgi:NADP-dependent aldehyde dehydrogenase